jgi:MinD superfamily P-loop ATPase
MDEVYHYATIVGVVVVVAAVLYYIDRRSKDEPMVFLDGAKIAAGAGTLAGGVVFALGGSDGVTSVTEPVVAAVQDMFVGKPEF